MTRDILPGIEGFNPKVRHSAPSREQRDRADEWFRTWHSLTPSQQAAWRSLSRSLKDRTYQMDAEEFASFMARIDDPAAA